MITGKASAWNGAFQYHWVHPNISGEEMRAFDCFQEHENWCKTQFGKPGSRWFLKGDKFYFKDEKDMTMFILRWS